MLSSHVPESIGAYVVFGITGDLSRRHILPALFKLKQAGLIPSDMPIIGIGRRPWNDRQLRDFLLEAPPLKSYTLEQTRIFLETVTYIGGDFEDEALFAQLIETIGAFTQATPDSTVIIHLSTPYTLYRTIIEKLHSKFRRESDIRKRILIEKPFGSNLSSATLLDSFLTEKFQADEIYRIDHYLFKTHLQSLPSFQKEDVSRIEMRLLETLGLEGRGALYDAIGAFRDVGQNHLLEVLATILLPQSSYLGAQEKQQARADVLHTLVLVRVIRAQYEGYREESDVAQDSQTETYARVECTLSGTSVILECGKAVHETKKEVCITLKDGKVITINLSDEGRSAYENLILEAIRGDQKDFISSLELRASWQFTDAVLRMYQTVPLVQYKKGTYPSFLIQ